MRKFSKLNESIKIDDNKVNSLLSNIQGFKYKIYDNYYYNPSGSLYKDVSHLEQGSRYSKLLYVYSEDISTERMDIDGWHEDLNFSNSGFSFFNDMKQARDYYIRIFGLIESLKEYSPMLCIKNGIFLILLRGDEASKGDFDLKDGISEAYEKLYDLLFYIKNKGNSAIKELSISKSNYVLIGMTLNIRLWGIIRTLCSQLSNLEEYSWMKKYKIIKEYDDIREEIYDMGFLIKFRELDKNTIKLIIYEP